MRIIIILLMMGPATSEQSASRLATAGFASYAKKYAE